MRAWTPSNSTQHAPRPSRRRSDPATPPSTTQTTPTLKSLSALSATRPASVASANLGFERGWPGLSVFAKARSFSLGCALCLIDSGPGSVKAHVGLWHSNQSDRRTRWGRGHYQIPLSPPGPSRRRSDPATPPVYCEDSTAPCGTTNHRANSWISACAGMTQRE